MSIIKVSFAALDCQGPDYSMPVTSLMTFKNMKRKVSSPSLSDISP
jgi:hypothetical protein